MSTFDSAHVRKNTRVFMPVQLQCSRSRLWEPGNEANNDSTVTVSVKLIEVTITIQIEYN